MPKRKPSYAQKIRVNIEKWRNFWKPNENNYNEWLQFVMGSQWLDEEARVFENYKKIPMTFNKVRPLMNYMAGQQRANTPSLECIPDESVPVPVAEVREALIKDISLSSDTDMVYQTAYRCSAIGGYGAFRICTEYENDRDFRQVIRLKAIKIPNNCFWDVSAENESKTDGMYAGWIVRISRSKFKAIYGKDIESTIGNDNLNDGTVFNDDDAITMTYYYTREYKPVKLYKLSNGRDIDQEEFSMLEKVELNGHEYLSDNGEPVTIVDTRTAPRYKIMFRLYAGEWELEKEEFPAQHLPVVFVDQDSFIDKEGKQVCCSFFKDTKDAQKYINYIGTSSAYLLKISRYDQFMLAKGNARGNDTAQIWRDPQNIQGGLIFDEVTSGVVPQQLRPPELPVSFIQQYERALMDIQTSTGIYEAQVGQQSNEISGTAINARKKGGSYVTSIPTTSLDRAILAGAKIINEMIPRVYDTERTMQLSMKDRGASQVTLNKSLDAYGSSIENDMTQGHYTIRLRPGPSIEGQKQEALEAMQALLQASPQTFSMIADLYVENLPLANNIELRNRLRTMVPPEIIQAGKTGEPIPPKPAEPNPQMIAAQAKMEEIKLKEQHLQIEQQKLQLNAQQTGEEIKQKWQALENQRLEAASALQEAELRYLAEAKRTQSDEQMSHANNLVKILTHSPKFEK